MAKRNPTHRLVYGTDPEYGNQGLRPAAQPDFNYFDGMGVAHDLLEHFPSDKGTLPDEFMALGAMLHVRKDYFWRMRPNNKNSITGQLTGDLRNLFGYWQGGQFPEGNFWTPPKAKKPELFDLAEYKKIVKSDAKTEVEPEDSKEYVRFAMAAIPWIYKGYWRARARFKHVHDTSQLFIDIEKSVNNAIRTISQWGDEVDVKLVYDRRNFNVDIYVKPDGYTRWIDVRDY